MIHTVWPILYGSYSWNLPTPLLNGITTDSFTGWIVELGWRRGCLAGEGPFEKYQIDKPITKMREIWKQTWVLRRSTTWNPAEDPDPDKTWIFWPAHWICVGWICVVWICVGWSCCVDWPCVGLGVIGEWTLCIFGIAFDGARIINEFTEKRLKDFPKNKIDPKKSPRR